MIRIAVKAYPGPEAVMELPDADRHYLTQVMRRAPGDEIEVLTPEGTVWRARILAAGRVQLLGESDAAWTPRRPITLVQALLKGDHFSEVVDRATQAGVAHFIPLVTERCIVREVKPHRLERWRTVAKEASEQSKRAAVPEVSCPMALSDLVVESGSQGFVLHPHASPGLPWQGRQGDPSGPLTLIVGPEGGLSSTEVEWLETRGFQALSLGPGVYRAENAGAFAAVLFLQDLPGTFGQHC